MISSSTMGGEFRCRTIVSARILAVAALIGLSSCGTSASIFARRVSLKLISIKSESGGGADEEVRIRGVADYFVHQDDPRSCWAASLATLLNFLNYSASQATFLERYRTSRHDACTTEQGLIRLACDETSLSATRDQIVDASMGAIHGWVSMDDSDTMVKPSFDAVETLSNGLPFLLLLWLGGEGHVYTVVGARYRRSDHTLDTLFVLDPSFNQNTEIPLSATRLDMGYPVVYLLKPSRRAHADVATTRVSD